MMPEFPYRTALIVGSDPGINAALARTLTALGLRVGLAARDTAKLDALVAETGVLPFATDAADPAAVDELFGQVTKAIGEPDVVIYNASARVQGPLAELEPAAVENALAVTAYGGLPRCPSRREGDGATPARRDPVHRGHGQRERVRALGALRHGEILAARAGAERGARTGIHVVHFVIDGAVRSERRPDPPDNPDSTLSPAAIAQAYVDVLRQERSAWSFEVELRPWVERF